VHACIPGRTVDDWNWMDENAVSLFTHGVAWAVSGYGYPPPKKKLA
jgi:hypothetical protein